MTRIYRVVAGWHDFVVAGQKWHDCRISSIYNSVVTCLHNIINSSASAPQSARKIAVKKVSYVYVSMFGPEL